MHRTQQVMSTERGNLIKVPIMTFCDVKRRGLITPHDGPMVIKELRLKVGDLILMKTEVVARDNDHGKLSGNWKGTYAVREEVFPGKSSFLGPSAWSSLEPYIEKDLIRIIHGQLRTVMILTTLELRLQVAFLPLELWGIMLNELVEELRLLIQDMLIPPMPDYLDLLFEGHLLNLDLNAGPPDIDKYPTSPSPTRPSPLLAPYDITSTANAILISDGPQGLSKGPQKKRAKELGQGREISETP
ncbi:hypothetical protein Cgig2_033836 [Carnegiea gigantea]|uniref:Uncharacterized protein n=1 Tax=Carnegiea gigantea TaxID=171969 RepID=A0A9Q1GMD1_9CARY|nr:hypothetical protein Cgig2_033836 [Carnegiea gigantea]